MWQIIIKIKANGALMSPFKKNKVLLKLLESDLTKAWIKGSNWLFSSSVLNLSIFLKIPMQIFVQRRTQSPLKIKHPIK